MTFKVYQKDKTLAIDAKGLNGVYLNTERCVGSDSVSLENLILGVGLKDKTAKVTFLDPGGRTTDLIEKLKESGSKFIIEFTDMNTNIQLKLSMRKAELSFSLTVNKRLVTIYAKVKDRTDTDLDFPI